MPEAAGPVVPPFNPKVTTKLVFDALQKAVRTKDMRLRVQTSAGECLAHVLKYVLNIIRWKKHAGPQGSEPPPDTVQNAMRNRDPTVRPGVIEWRQVEQAAWDEWAQDGGVPDEDHPEPGDIWPETWQGYAHPGSRLRRPNMDRLVLREAEGRRKELHDEHKRQSSNMRLEDETAAREREEEIKALEAKIEELRRPVNEAEIRRHALVLARPFLDKLEVKGWHDIAEELQEILCEELPGQGAEAAYRFMKAIMPVVTEEAVLPDTIKRFVNRGPRETRDTK
jgi:hypothetical protein